MGVGGGHLCRNQRLKKSPSGSTHPPPPTRQGAAGTVSLVGKSREELNKTEGQGTNITVSTEEKVNGTAAGAECGKCRSSGWGVRRKLDLYWGSPGERGNGRGLCSTDFTTLSLPGSFLVLLIKKPRPAASSRSH